MSRVQPTPEGPPPPGKPRRGAGRNLPLAILSGVVLAVLFLGTLFTSHLLFIGFLAILVVVALFEVHKAFLSHDVRSALPIALGAGVFLMFGTYAGGSAAQALGVALLLLGAMAYVLLDVGRTDVLAGIAATALMGLWVPFMASFAGLLLARPDGEWYVVACVAATVFGDIGAYAFGQAFGRHKMAPRISPGKSWEGLAGGLATGIVVAAVAISRFPGFDMRLALVFGLACILAGTVGDLSESMVKRDLGVKDLGGIVPGHGGIMDRADAIVFAFPVAHAVLLLFGR